MASSPSETKVFPPIVRRYLRMRWVSALLGGAGLLLFWSVASYGAWFDKTLIATPTEVIEVLGDSFASDAARSDQIHRHALSSIARALRGWGMGVIVGTAFGLALGSWIGACAATEPVVEFFRAIPPVLAFPLFLVAFNYDSGAYIWTIFFGCVPVVILTVARGTQGVSREPLALLKTHGVDVKIRLLAMCAEMLPVLVLAARISFSMALIVGIVTEMVITPRSGWALGALARDAEIDFDTPTFYGCVLLIGLFGYAVNLLMRLVEQRLRPSAPDAAV